jgi:Fe-S oxidoreductase
LAALNVEMFAEAQPERIITVCPECSLTLDREYRERFGVPAAEVMHISEFIAAHAAELPLAAMPQTVTFEDPCRLGRHQGKYDAPRNALATVPELELREMAHSRHRATCCAGSWLSCNQATKRIQTDLLREAAATGSELLVTACPKCQIHLKCAQAGDDAEVPDIEIRDLASVVAAALTVTTSAEEKG